MQFGVVRPHQYTNYSKAANQKDLEAVWSLLSQPERLSKGLLQRISTETQIPIDTLKTWRKKLRANSDYRPVLGAPNRPRVLTDDLERRIYEVITEQYISCGRYCPKYVLRTIALDIVGTSLPKFRASHSWIAGFMHRWGLSVRRPHIRRRSLPRDELVAKFVGEFDVALMQLPKNLIFNMDESAWRLVNGELRTIARRGSDEVIMEMTQDIKATITVIATIDVDGGKHPIWIIARGKTAKCENKYRNDPRLRKYIKSGDLIVSHSASGWATAELMKSYLAWLDRRTGYRRKYLVWDLHSSHRDESVKQYAEKKNTYLSFIPAGQTAIWQPLDRRIFGQVKQICHMRFQQMMTERPLEELDMIDAIIILLEVWQTVRKRHIKAAWSHLIEVEEEPEYEYDYDAEEEEEDVSE